jgi:hypothetical protein
MFDFGGEFFFLCQLVLFSMLVGFASHVPACSPSTLLSCPAC